MLSRRLACALLITSCLPGQQQDSRRSTNWPCAGGRAVDPSYAAVAEGSGGHLYMLDSSEIAQSGRLMMWHQKHTETVFRAMGELSQDTREFAFPVDSMVESLLLTASLQCNRLVSILDPTGARAAGEEVEFRAGKALRVSHPAPGVWKVRLAGSGLFFVTAEAVSDLSLDQARFVEAGGRPGHEGLFPVKNPPTLGSTAMLRLDVANAPERIRLRLIDSGGQTLDASDLNPLSPGSYLTNIVLRHSAFRIAIEGTDGRGWPFQRLDGPLTVMQAPLGASQ